MTKVQGRRLVVSAVAFLVAGILARTLFASDEVSPGARAAISRAIVADRLFDEAKLAASDAQSFDELGWSVAISGDTVVVGAPSATVGANIPQGAVYVFVKPSGGWSSTSTFDAKLTVPDGAGGDAWGFSVAISGDTVVIGAIGATVGSNLQQGAVYVFVKPSSGWSSTSSFDAKLTASDGAANDSLGFSVAISGDTVVAGAPYAKIGTNVRQGTAYLFTKPPGGWVNSTEDAKLAASGGSANLAFGSDVAVSGDTVVAGAYGATVGSNFQQGAAYVFVKPPAGWSSTSAFDAKLTASDGEANDSLGSSVAISGDTVVAGAIGVTVGSNPQQGAVYVFVKPVSGWASTSAFDARLIASDGSTNDYLGNSVAISRNTVVAGAPFSRVGSNVQQGAAYVFVKPWTGWSSTSAFDARLVASGGVASGWLGFSVAISGETVVTGAPSTWPPGSIGFADVFEGERSLPRVIPVVPPSVVPIRGRSF